MELKRALKNSQESSLIMLLSAAYMDIRIVTVKMQVKLEREIRIYI